MRYLALITILFAATLHAQEEPKLYTNEELLESVGDATASELRWITSSAEFWGFSSGYWGLPPRSMTAFGRLLAQDDTELFLRMAQAADPVTAGHGCIALRWRHQHLLPELLPVLIQRRDTFHSIYGDIGATNPFTTYAASALDQLSPSKDIETLKSMFRAWVRRVLDKGSAREDRDLGACFISVIGLNRFMELKFQDEDVTRIQRILRDVLDKYLDLERLQELAGDYAHGSVEHRFILRMYVNTASYELDEWAEAVIRGAKDRDLDEATEQHAVRKFLCEVMNEWITMPIVELDQINDFVDVVRSFKELDEETWLYLIGHESRSVRGFADEMQKHPLYNVDPAIPVGNDPVSLIGWYSTQFGSDEEVWNCVDKALASDTSLIKKLVRAYDSFNAIYQDYCPYVARDDVPRHWIRCVTSEDPEVLRWLCQSVETNFSFADDVGVSDSEEFKTVHAAINKCATSEDLHLKWAARRAQWALAQFFAEDEDAAHAAWVKTNARAMAKDLMMNPRYAPRSFNFEHHFNFVNNEWIEAGPGLENLTPPGDDSTAAAWQHWHVFVWQLMYVTSSFERGDYHPSEQTRDELQDKEGTPAEYWKRYREVEAKLIELEDAEDG